jgi:hypothetical protein
MQLENEARTRMGNDDGGRVGGGDERQFGHGDADGRQLATDVNSSSGSGGYRYAAIEQAMDASASGKPSPYAGASYIGFPHHSRRLHSEPGWACTVLYGSTSGVASGKRSTDGLGGNSYEAEEYSYQLSGAAAAGGYEAYAFAGTGASTSLTGSRPLTACGKHFRRAIHILVPILLVGASGRRQARRINTPTMCVGRLFCSDPTLVRAATDSSSSDEADNMLSQATEP